MSETSDLIRDMAEKLFGDLCDRDALISAEQGAFPQTLWDAMTDAGLARPTSSEEQGGSGLSIGDALVALRVSAFHAAPAPLAETIMAEWLARDTALALPDGPLTAGLNAQLQLTEDGPNWRVRGTIKRAPFARHCVAVLALAEHKNGAYVVCLPVAQAQLKQGQNLAREPRDDLSFDIALPQSAAAPARKNADDLRAFGAALRTVQIAGALNRTLDLSIAYVQERVQFGKPISKFQAIQHNMAMLAAHSAAASAAADMAAEEAEGGMDKVLIGAAKTPAGEAASVGAALAHAAHGAIGFTHDHRLHFSTKRLWSWRDECGKESEWSLLVGRAALQAGPQGVWREIVARAGAA